MDNKNANANSDVEINNKIVNGQIKPLAPFLIVLARPALALISQGMMVLLFMGMKHPSPASTATAWWTVYGTVIDIGCLLILLKLVQREGIRIPDLVSFDRKKLFIDIIIGLGIFIIVFPITMVAGSDLASILVYGKLQPNLPQGALIRILPMWAVLYSRIIWWVIWSVTEELTYQGYALPRLRLITGRTWPAILWVGFGWALQHSFLPFFNFSHAVWLFLTFFPLTIALQLLYIRFKRLFPIIVSHWLMDFASVLFLLTNS